MVSYVKWCVMLSMLLMVCSWCSAIGEKIGEKIVLETSDADSIEDPPVFVPAEPVTLQTGWCCEGEAYNVTTVEHYLRNETMHDSYSKAAVYGKVSGPCPSRLYPNRPTEADCINYVQRYYIVTRVISRKHHRATTREYACATHGCCAGYFSYRKDYCLTQAECDFENQIARMTGQPETCGI